MVDPVTSSWYSGISPRDSVHPVHSVEHARGDDVVDSSDPVSDVNLSACVNPGSGDVSDGHVSDDLVLDAIKSPQSKSLGKIMRHHA